MTDPIVRIEAARLRDRLREYYETDGQSDPIRIELPKGTYTPHIEFRQGEQQVNNISKPVRVYRVPADPRPISQRAALAKIGWTRLAMLAAALLLIIAAGSWGLQGWNSGPSLPDKPSIAVLPFDNIGDDPNGIASQMGSPRTSLPISPTLKTYRHRSEFHRGL